ncbi:MAG TPA: hypothetical protein VFE50_09980 [Cyclobacteriaceae bacterium]|nr:hypothetical protein [Cyclobacteriaceae bacterium]
MKDLHEDDIFGSIRERMGRYEEAPSDELWAKIAAQQKSKDRVWPLLLEATSYVAMGVLVISLLNSEVKKVDVKTVSADKKIEVVKEGGEQQQIIEKQEQVPLIEKDTERKEMIAAEIETVPAAEEKTEQINEESLVEQPEEIVEKPEEKLQETTAAEVVPPYKKPKSKFQFYFSVTPSLSFQKIIPSGNDNLIIQGLEHRSPLSMKRFGFGIDAGFQRDINRIFGYYGGVSFYRQQQELTYNYYNKDAQVTRVGDEWVFEINRQQQSKTFDYSMTNIGVTSGLLVTIKGDKLKHKLGAGLAYSYNFKKASYVSYQLFYRNELEINEHLGWFIEPTFIYSFISKEKLNEPFTLKPYRAGITTGLLYRF